MGEERPHDLVSEDDMAFFPVQRKYTEMDGILSPQARTTWTLRDPLTVGGKLLRVGILFIAFFLSFSAHATQFPRICKN